MNADDQQLEAVLVALTAPDTSRIKQAEDALKPVLKKSACVGALMTQVASSGNVAVRQIAAVILRKKIVKLWKKLKKSAQTRVKAAILERLGSEPERAVRKSVAALASALAKVLVPHNKWPELLAFISQCATAATSPQHRELAYLLLLQLSETVATSLSSQLGQLAQLFRAALGDEERAVSVMALRACCAFVSTLSTDDDAMLFRDLVPPMVVVARSAAQQRDDAVLVQFFDAFAELAQTPVPVLAPHVGDVVPLLLDVMRAGDDDLERATRDGAASVIGALAEWKPKLLGKVGLVPTIVQTCVGIMVTADASAREGGGAGALFVSTPLQRLRQEEAALAKAAKIAAGQVVLGGDDDDDEAYEGPSSQEVAQTTLDQIALHVPLKWSLEPTLGLAMQCLEDANPSTRRAGAAAVGVVAEGFQDALREHHLGEVLQRLANAAAANSEPATRECLCFAYGQLAEHCQPEIVGHAAAVVPVVFEFLNDARAAVVGTSCYVLEMFCESMDASQLGQLLEPLMARLLPLLGHQLLGIREMAAAAVGSAAIAAADGFGPYLDVAAPPLAAMCELGEERAWELRGRSLEALGHVALAVGAARFAPYRDRALAAAAQNLELDSTELAEYSYGFFANAAKVMRGDFGPLLPQLVPHLLDVVARKDGAGDDDDEEPREPGDADEWEDDVEDEESDDDLAGHAVMTVRTAMMNVKRAAIVALGNVAEYTEGHFAPHLDKSLDVLRVMVDYFHHEIRERSAIALQQLAHAACVAHGGSARALPYAPRTANDDKEPVAIAWAKGDGAASLPSPQLATYVNACVGLLARLLAEDTAKSVVAVSCEALNELLGDVGPAALIPALQPIVEATLQLANKQAPCQTLLGADDDVIDAVARGTHEEGDDDDEDHDNVLMDNVADLCGAVAKVGGGLVGHGTADAVFQAFAKYAQPARAASDRAMALGCFAELCVELPPDLAAGRHFAQLWGLFSSACGDAHSNVARNAAFGVGALFSAAGPAFARQHIPDALHALYPLVTKADGAPPERAAADRARTTRLSGDVPHRAGGSRGRARGPGAQATLAQDKIDDADIVAQCTELLAKLG
ncbi:hypothetical protein JL720_700 [Aureococcus anophagefferens]|nr:hypothetical protein JL720_700 [Aureococcus anophagefferens]